MRDNDGREYARYSKLRVGDQVQVDSDFEGCFIPWSVLTVVSAVGSDKEELALIHNDPECGACGGESEGEPCHHFLAGQIDGDDDFLVGLYARCRVRATARPHRAYRPGAARGGPGRAVQGVAATIVAAGGHVHGRAACGGGRHIWEL